MLLPSNPRGNKLIVKHSREIHISQLDENGKPLDKIQCKICGYWVNNLKKHNNSSMYQKRHRRITKEVKCN